MVDYRRVSLDTGLPMQFAIKEHKMYELLSKLLAAGWSLPLVGGTAINKIYLAGEERFSEDLDFELYGKRKIKPPAVEGYRIKGPFTYRRNVRFEAEYTEEKKDHIRIDVNIRPRARVKTVKKTARFLTGNTVANLDTFTLEALLARKLLAMSRRTEGKDFYDVWHAMSKTDEKALAKEVRFLSRLEKVKFIAAALSRIERTGPKELSKFNNYIPIERRPDWRLVRRDILETVARLG